jgi:hypothetical protein
MSAVMVSEARKRVPQTNKVRVIESDLFQFAFTGEKYDIAFSHFFLDCFDTQEAGSLVRLVSPHLTQQAVWIVSDFRQLKKGWRKLYAGACLKTMYLFFRLAAGLETRQLPDYDSALEAAGFARRREQLSMAGFIASEWWQR